MICHKCSQQLNKAGTYSSSILWMRTRRSNEPTQAHIACKDSLGLNTGLSDSNLSRFASPGSGCSALPSGQCLGSAPMELFLPHSPPHPPFMQRELASGCPLVPVFSGLPTRTASLSKLQALEGRACASCFSFIYRVYNRTSRLLKMWCRSDWGLDSLTYLTSSHLISSHLGNIPNLKLFLLHHSSHR